ncbi:MAG: hypothetical protein WAV15_00065 [Minisyncoccia bacterium]
MITKELLDYVRGELQKGKTREEINQTLIAGGGWTAEDLNEVFLKTVATGDTIISPIAPSAPATSFVPPGYGAPVGSAVKSAPIEPANSGHKHTKLLVGIIALILIVAGAGGAYGYYSGFFISLPRLTAEALSSAKDAKSATYDTTINIDFSESKEVSDSLQLFAEGMSGINQVNVTVKGAYDISDKENTKGTTAFSASLGAMSLAGEFRFLNDILYSVITKAPTLSMFPIGASIENKWVSIPLKSENGPIPDSPLSALSPVNPNVLGELTDEQKARLFEMLREASLVKTVKKLPPETILGESAYHFVFDLDQEGIRSYLQAVKEYVNTVGKDNSALSSFNPESFYEELAKMEDFEGEIWIGRSDKLPRKVSLKFGIGTKESSNEKVKITIVSIFSDWNKPISITAPAESVPLETFFNEMMSGALSVESEIKAGLSNLRAEAELFYDKKPANAYLGFCSTDVVKNSRKAIEVGGGTEFACKDSKTAWAATAKLPDSSDYWCVDYTGFSEATKDKLTATVCK